MTISNELYLYLSIDLPPLLTALFVSLSCALLGNLLILRRLSLLGDAMSHSVLPGIVLAFLLTQSRASFPVFIGAALAALLTAMLVELVSRLGRLESGAAMGVVFSIFFAAGVVLIEQAAARSIDLDADCLLHGQLETLFWYPPQNLDQLLSWQTLTLLPRQLVASIVVFLICASFLLIFAKELKLISFDVGLASSLGFSPKLLHYALLTLVAAAVVVSFEAVGSILVIAMLIVPGASARLLTDRYLMQFLLSALIAVIGVSLGYAAAAFGPRLFGSSSALNAAGMIVTMLGLLLLSAVIFAPRYGIFARKIRGYRLSVSVAREDVLGMLYRLHELSGQSWGERAKVEQALLPCHSPSVIKSGIRSALKRGMVMQTTNGISLTPAGRELARAVVRTHRLWESYLVKELGLRPDHVHNRAEQLEHFTSPSMAQELNVVDSAIDPHGKRIPRPSVKLDS